MKLQLIKGVCATVVAAGLAVLLTSCKANQNNVLAITTTVLGVQVHQKDADKTPEMKVGYARTEFAFVPTDKSTNGTGSATNSAEVLMEINAQGNLGLGAAYQGGIYQRLAVGRIAVTQPGAALMMAKDQNGNLSSDAVKKATEAIKSIPAYNPSAPATPNAGGFGIPPVTIPTNPPVVPTPLNPGTTNQPPQ